MTPILVLVTVSSVEEGMKIARALVEKQLAACVNLLPDHTSIYRWEGKIETASEHLLLIKSAKELWESLQAEVKTLHSYECPEIVALRAEEIEAGYAKWWNDSLIGPY